MYLSQRCDPFVIDLWGGGAEVIKIPMGEGVIAKRFGLKAALFQKLK